MSRLIDRLPQPDKILEKKVIVLSRSRVGTASMYESFKMIGFKPYHLRECIRVGGTTHINLFQEAMRNKYYGEGKPYDKADFDKWLANYDAIVEIPQFFLPEFVEFYPNAKFILTERSLDSWAKSIDSVFSGLTHRVDSFPLSVVRHVDSEIDAFASFIHLLNNIIFHGRGPKGGMALAQADLMNNGELARKLIPESQLLYVKLEDGFGWEQICPFLGLPIPEQPYPRGNTPLEVEGNVTNFARRHAALSAIKVIGSALLITGGAWLYRKQR